MELGLGLGFGSSRATVTPPTPITITAQPEGRVSDGSPVALSVVATGSLPITYQWQSSDAGAGVWSNIPGETADTVFVSPIVTTDYRVIVTNPAGSVASDTATVTVESA